MTTIWKRASSELPPLQTLKAELQEEMDGDATKHIKDDEEDIEAADTGDGGSHIKDDEDPNF